MEQIKKGDTIIIIHSLYTGKEVGKIGKIVDEDKCIIKLINHNNWCNIDISDNNRP